jgi:hypothetical protein
MILKVNKRNKKGTDRLIENLFPFLALYPKALNLQIMAGLLTRSVFNAFPSF